MKKLIPKSKITSGNGVKKSEILEEKYNSTAFDILLQAQHCWDSLRGFREERKRNTRYTYGDQWSDVIENEVGERMTEEEYIKSQGSVPLKNNLIRRLTRTVMGVYRNQNKEPTCTANDRDEQQLSETMSIALKCNWDVNRMTELNGRMFEEFLIDGMAITKELFEWRDGRKDCWTDTPQHDYIFFDGEMRDYRHWDLSIIGEIHDVKFETVCSSFAGNSNDYRRLKEIYSFAGDRSELKSRLEKLGNRRNLENIDFLLSPDSGLCRVIEVWRKEMKPRFRCHDYLHGDYYLDEIKNEGMILSENRSRLEEGRAAGMAEEEIPLIDYEWFMDSFWYYRFMTPFGQILTEGETPYKHRSHPYTIKMYPFINGEIHSFVSDVIDQQRYVNRLITLDDWIVKASAKGVLMFPEELMPEGMSIEDLQVEWTKHNGIIFYKSKPGVTMPTQIANNSTNVGAFQMLQLQMSLMEDVSGVTGALQGKQGYSGMSGTLYAQQQQNASASLADILESFSHFIKEGAIKKVKNIQQFYDTKRVINIAGKKANGVVEYDPSQIKEVEFDLSINESTATPAIRAAANEMLLMLFNNGAITVEQLLECGSFPFADTLLQSIQVQKEKMAEQNVPTDPQIVE